MRPRMLPGLLPGLLRKAPMNAPRTLPKTPPAPCGHAHTVGSDPQRLALEVFQIACNAKGCTRAHEAPLSRSSF